MPPVKWRDYVVETEKQKDIAEPTTELLDEAQNWLEQNASPLWPLWPELDQKKKVLRLTKKRSDVC